MPEITLSDGTNSHKYVVLDPVTEYQPPVLTNAFRTSGIERREDNTKLKRFFFSGASHVGQGVLRMKREFAGDHGGNEALHAGTLYEANADTRFSTAISLPPLDETVAHATPSDHLITHEHFKGELWGIFEEDYASDALQNITALFFDASADAWTSGNTAGVFNPTVAGSSNGAGASSTLTVSRAVQTTYGNRISIAFVSHEASADPSGVTEAGNSMTKYASRAYTGAHTQMNISAWYKINPTTGTQNYIASGLTGDNAMVVFDLHSCPQTNPFRTAANTAGESYDGSSTVLMNATTTPGDLVVGGVSLTAGADGGSVTSAITSGSGQTELAEPANGTLRMAVSHEAAAVGGAVTTAHTYTYSGTDNMAAISFAIIGGGIIATANDNAHGLRVFGSCVHKGELWVIGSAGSGDELKYMVYSSANGHIFGTEANSAFPTADYLQTSVTRVADGTGWRQGYADIMSFGANIIAAVYEDPDSDGGSISQVRVGYSANAGGAWTFPAALIIPCSDTPNITLTTINDPFDATTPVVPALVTSDGVYTLDITGSAEVFASVVPPGTVLSGQANDALAVTRASDGNLYVGTQGGDVVVFTVESAGRVIPKSIGPATKAHMEDADGPTTARAGYVTAMWGGSTRWLFVGYGGHSASTYAQVLAYDYETGGWHTIFLAEDDDIGDDVDISYVFASLESDGTARLHAVSEGAAACRSFMFENYDRASTSTAARKYKDVGYLNWSEDDLADPHKSSGVMRILMDAYDLSGSTSGEHVDIQYGIDGATWTTSTLSGDFLSSVKSLSFGTGGAGIAAKTIRIRMNLKRGSTNTNSPKVVDWELQVRTKQERLQGFVCNIDVARSAALQRVPAKTVIERINTTIDQVPAVAFEWADTGTLYVDVHRELQGDTTSKTGVSSPAENRRTSGIIPLSIEQVLPA